MTKQTKGAIIGGIIAGFVCLIPRVNGCCCLYATAAGLLAGYIAFNGSSLPVTSGEGAILGAKTGSVAVIFYALLMLPILLLLGPILLPITQLDKTADTSYYFGKIIGYLLAPIAGTVLFAVVGGVLSVTLFGKKGGQSQPPQSPPPANVGDASNPFQTRI